MASVPGSVSIGGRPLDPAAEYDAGEMRAYAAYLLRAAGEVESAWAERQRVVRDLAAAESVRKVAQLEAARWRDLYLRRAS